MAIDFNKFYERRLWSARIGTEVLTWICIGFLYDVVVDFIPEPSCLVLEPYGEMDAEDLRRLTCMGAYYMRIPPIIWIFFTVFRTFFIVLRQTDPLLWLEKLKVERIDQRPLKFADAVFYPFIEWLPMHLTSIYILAIGVDINIFTFFCLSIMTLTAQILWLIPFKTNTGKKIIPDMLTGMQIVFSEKEKLKTKELYQKRTHRIFSAISFHTGRTLCIILISLFIFLSLQILRMPKINTTMERLLYADKAPVWNDNVYFAIAGLKAPADSSDSVAYGRAIATKNFRSYEDAKAFAHIPYAYSILPETKDLPPLRKDQEIFITNDGWKDLYCLVSPELGSADTECATEGDLQSYIDAHTVMWNRFNALPGDVPYHPFPQFDNAFAEEFMTLALMKAAHIVVMSNNGQGEEAFDEWYKYMTLYRSMAGVRETAYFKASVRLVIAYHVNALRQLLYVRPELAKYSYKEINNVLDENALFHEELVMLDEIAITEPWILAFTGNINAVRNNAYECLATYSRITSLPAHEFPYRSINQDFCYFDKNSHFWHTLMQPGFFMSNLMAEALYRGILGGSSRSFPQAAKLQYARIRMTLLGVEILSQGVKEKEISAFIASVSPKLQNPITQKPFEWDAEKKSLYLVDPKSGKRFDVPLNLGNTNIP